VSESEKRCSVVCAGQSGKVRCAVAFLTGWEGAPLHSDLVMVNSRRWTQAHSLREDVENEIKYRS
jgi:hypothetical protein